MKSVRIKNKPTEISWLMTYVIIEAVLSELIHFLVVIINQQRKYVF